MDEIMDQLFEEPKQLVKPIELTENGKACSWESGGGGYNSNEGEVVIISNASGNAKKPILVRNPELLGYENDNQALIPIKTNDYVIKVVRFNSNIEYKAYKIVSINKTTLTMTLELVEHIPNKLFNAVNAGIAKCKDYCCRVPYYIDREGKD